jgi:nucleotide-binding universal stress UspA family protein
VAEAVRVNADLIVVGTHGRSGLRRALLGSDAEALVRETTLPVMLVHAAEAAR